MKKCRKLENDLLYQFMPMIIKIANSFCPKNRTEYEEYLSLGQLGLVKAAQKHDIKKGALSTIAYYSIRTEISNYRRSCRKNPLFDVDYDLDNTQEKIKQDIDIYDYLPIMTQEEKEIIGLYLKKHTFEEIGNIIGMSRQYVQTVYYKIIKRAKNKNGQN